ncbi:MAG: molybdopterin-binding protein [Candidatus Bathyarchaeia archaeon]
MFRRLMTLEEAEGIIIKNLKVAPLGIEEVDILEACGRVLAVDVVSGIDVPPFNRSTVDGYAVRSEDTFGADENNPIRLRVCGAVSVGEVPKISIGRGEAVEIMTGAPIPDGADAVVMSEHAERMDNEVYIYRAVTKYANIMKAGSDIKRGETVLTEGMVLGAREIGALAAIGLSKVKVYKVPRVAVLSTGAEVTEPGKPLESGKIYDINAYSLSVAVKECGGNPIYLGVFPDDALTIEKALKKALSDADVVITSGGVSVGPKDLIPRVLNTLGDPGVVVCGVAIKPGKPTTVAIIGDKPVFALPGHPASALLVFYLLVRPIIMGLAGRKPKEETIKAIASTRMFSDKGRKTFVMVNVKKDECGRLLADPVSTGLSGAITTLLKADGFIEIPENQQFIDVGEEVVVHLFREL